MNNAQTVFLYFYFHRKGLKKVTLYMHAQIELEYNFTQIDEFHLCTRPTDGA